MDSRKVCALIIAASTALLPLFPADAKKDKQPKVIPGVNDEFKGINSVQGQPHLNDPLWERYLYAGKRMLERRDIAQAQAYYWAACFELQDVANGRSTKVKFDDTAKNILTAAFALSNDVFFQDPNPSNIQDTPPPFPQPLLEDEKGRVEPEMKKLVDAQAEFDQKHPSFDGGVRLRVMHLRRRLAFNTIILPVMQKLLGTEDSITEIVNDEFQNDTREMKEFSS